MEMQKVSFLGNKNKSKHENFSEKSEVKKDVLRPMGKAIQSDIWVSRRRQFAF